VQTTKKRRARRKPEEIGSKPSFVFFVSSWLVLIFAVPISFKTERSCLAQIPRQITDAKIGKVFRGDMEPSVSRRRWYFSHVSLSPVWVERVSAEGAYEKQAEKKNITGLNH
jgi:hypothetical protein